MDIFINEDLQLSVAVDILYGNTPRDMINRAFSNDDLKREYDKLKIIVKSDAYVKHQIDVLMNESGLSKSFLGKYVAYLSLYHKLNKKDAISLVREINSQTSSDNFIHKINDELIKF